MKRSTAGLQERRGRWCRLEEGRRIFLGPCASCHAPDPLSKHTLARWDAIVGEMTPKAKLTPERRAALLAYLHGAKSVTAAR